MFKFDLGDAVSLNASSEAGDVVGCAKYADSESQYKIYYKAADGRAVESWWDESRLTLKCKVEDR